jgi:hypothetical protein
MANVSILSSRGKGRPERERQEWHVVRKPMPPPDTAEILDRLQERGMERFMHVLGTREEVEVASDPYLPWDKLRYKTPPAGLSHEEWWLVTKLRRQGMQRRLPLLDKEGRNFSYALPDDALKAIEEVNRSLSGHISMAEKVANSENRDRYLVNSLMKRPSPPASSRGR